jgi:hypothetical protein
MRKLHVTLAMAIFTIGFGSIAMSEEAILPQEDRYAPKQWGSTRHDQWIPGPGCADYG